MPRTVLLLLLGLASCVDSPEGDEGANDAILEETPTSVDVPRLGCVTTGRGGRLRDRTFQPFAARDQSTTQYHLYARGRWSATPGLLVYLHGAGARDFENPTWNIDGIAETARRHDLITLAVRTPAADETWHTEPMHNAAVLSELISRVVLQKFAIDTQRVVIVGYSSGAVFTTAFYLPLHGEDFCGGGSILFGEGRPPWFPELAAHDYASEFVRQFKLHFYAGKQDPLVQESIAGAAFYARRGFTVSEQHPDNIGHLDIPFARVVQARLDRGFLPPP